MSETLQVMEPPERQFPPRGTGHRSHLWEPQGDVQSRSHTDCARSVGCIHRAAGSQTRESGGAMGDLILNRNCVCILQK